MHYGKEFLIDKDSKFIIYGAATTGAILYHNLKESGYKIIAFVDKRADEIDSYLELPVWNLRQAEKYFGTCDDVIVIIAIKNVFEHEKIAKTIWNLGCNKIIFRPSSVIEGRGKTEDLNLNVIYDNAIKGRLVSCYVIEKFDKIDLEDCAIIKEGEDYVVANIPSQYIFTDDYQNKEIIWGDIPCWGLVPHVGLFQLFSGIPNCDYKEYILFCRQAAQRSGGIVTSKAWEESVFSNRLDVYNHMKLAWEHDRSFFVVNAVEASYNDKGYFNIKSGKHRVIFQMVQGSQYIPLRIKKADYYKWNNKDLAIKVKNLLENSGRDALPIIIGNPFYYKYSCNSSDFYKKVLDRLISMIYKERYYKGERLNLQGEKILLYNTALSLYADFFVMIGFEVLIYEKDDERKELIGTLCKDKCTFINQIDDEKYLWAVLEEFNQTDNVNALNILYISDKEDEHNSVSGMKDGQIVFARFN